MWFGDEDLCGLGFFSFWVYRVQGGLGFRV